mmetsp:Transcript_132698/g.301568  ORF Transcript_132698/g.301568 Transcript_132698/m.301568 type:complete len:137 (+) Transcript_132698:37-447(+)
MSDSDLDEEDLAVLAEVKKKGYYHGRLHNAVPQPSYAPVRLDGAAAVVDSTPQRIEAPATRHVVDSFQAKWDKWDRDDFVEQVAEDLEAGAAPQVASLDLMDLTTGGDDDGPPVEAVGSGGLLRTLRELVSCPRRR